MNSLLAPSLVLLLFVGCATGPRVDSPRIRLAGSTELRQSGAFEVVGLPSDTLALLAHSELGPEQWTRIFSVRVQQPGSAQPQPPVVGSYSTSEVAVSFRPRFPLEPGLSYQARFAPSEIPNAAPHSDAPPIETIFTIPARPRTPSAVVASVFPSADQLPENQLKFYVHFSSPMSQGEAYQHLHLYRHNGAEVELPFLVLDEELWDYEGKRLTVFFDPGRVKRELLPREQEGPALLEGNRYTLVIDQGWKDAHGTPMKSTFRKVFRAGPPDYQSPRPETWSIGQPRQLSRDPLVVDFPEPLDHALLDRLLWVARESGDQIVGRVSISRDETRWTFVPDSPWPAAPLNLVAQTTLEDLAGNSIAKPFEVDIFPPVERRITAETVSIPLRLLPNRR